MMKRNILLIEPDYKNKYPPIALMKLSTYHKIIGDDVVFCKGKCKELQTKEWDRIYVATVFTFHYKKVIETINYYRNSLKEKAFLYVGGAMATIMENELLNDVQDPSVKVLKGLLDNAGILDDNDIIIDELILDYDIIDINKNEFLTYVYPVSDAYFLHTTRGCIRNCSFCAVPKIEPVFKPYFSIKDKISQIKELYGEKKDLMIMDNNILASDCLEKIIDEIIKCGYGVDNNNYTIIKNGKKQSRKRYVDFNQGLDARLIAENPNVIDLLSKVAVRPIRIAFDHANEEFIDIYTKAMNMTAEKGISNASNYIMYNFNDTPSDLYKRLRINVELNEKYLREEKQTRIWSFPMRYSPLFGDHAKDRKYVGKHWTKKEIRGVQCILNATHGLVGPKIQFFNRAFGKTEVEFNEILWMPEPLIIYRKANEDSGVTDKWRKLFNSLTERERADFKRLISNNTFEHPCDNPKILELLDIYKKK